MPVRRSAYFFWASLFMLVLVLAGFGPTFFLRPLFDKPDLATGSRLPLHLMLHGISLATWYALITLQAWLVYSGSTRTHRALGKAGVVVAVCTVLSSFVVLAKVYPRRLEAGVPVPDAVVESFRGLMVIQGGNVLLFALCFALAIYFRNHREIHKRLMLIGSVMIFGAALSTNRMFGAAVQELLPFSLNTAIHLLLVGSLVAHDLLKHRRMLLLSLPAAVFIMNRSWFFDLVLNTSGGVAYANWLGGLPQ